MLTQIVASALLTLASGQDTDAQQDAQPGVTSGAATEQLPPVAAKAEDVRPLLPGFEIPSVEVRLPGDQPLDVAEFVAEGPTIVLFYRGGW